MKIYKYRDFSSPSEDDFRRLEDSVHRLLVWCARPDTLNDPQEFVWQCDYTPTPATLALLTGVLVKARDRTNTDAKGIAAAAIQNGRLEIIAKPVFDGMIEQCRNEIGLACFGATPDNPTLWRRYGGDGAGVCIEFEVPADLLGTQLHRVEYPKEKRLHVDQLMRAFVDGNEAQVVYEVALLSKPSSWADEEEIRFVSQRHSILVAIDRAKVTCVFLGDSLGADVRARIERIAGQVPLAERDR
jgi:Protein of unknown function (DUF2971)